MPNVFPRNEELSSKALGPPTDTHFRLGQKKQHPLKDCGNATPITAIRTGQGRPKLNKPTNRFVLGMSQL